MYSSIFLFTSIVLVRDVEIENVFYDKRMVQNLKLFGIHAFPFGAVIIDH
jgi:hypothetical protein